MINADAALQVFGEAGGNPVRQPVLSPFGLNKRKGEAQQDE